MLAGHPAQVATITAGFTATPDEIERARRIVNAFATQPGVGAVALDGQMIDAPHLKQALRVLGASS